MPEPIIPVNVRGDRPSGDQLKHRIVRLRGEGQTAFLHTLQRMQANRIPTADCAEVLNARYETYPLDLGGSGLVLFCDLDTRMRCWTLLDLAGVGRLDAEAEREVREAGLERIQPARAKQHLYREACAAHGLVHPSRETLGE
jgi:hypothetical protein